MSKMHFDSFFSHEELDSVPLYGVDPGSPKDYFLNGLSEKKHSFSKGLQSRFPGDYSFNGL